jgi:hypothetical protein
MLKKAAAERRIGSGPAFAISPTPIALFVGFS